MKTKSFAGAICRLCGVGTFNCASVRGNSQVPLCSKHMAEWYDLRDKLVGEAFSEFIAGGTTKK